MNATEAKELLLPIPTDDFLKSKFSNYKDKCCAVGHLQRLKSDCPEDYSWNNCSDFENPTGEVYKFCRIQVSTFLRSLKTLETTPESCLSLSLSSGLSLVNNNELIISHYNQEDPKSRVIALLDDMIETGY